MLVKKETHGPGHEPKMLDLCPCAPMHTHQKVVVFDRKLTLLTGRQKSNESTLLLVTTPNLQEGNKSKVP